VTEFTSHLNGISQLDFYHRVRSENTNSVTARSISECRTFEIGTLVVEIVPLRVVEMVPVAVVEIVPVLVVEMFPVFVVEIVPVFERAVNDKLAINNAEHAVTLKLVIELVSYAIQNGFTVGSVATKYEGPDLDRAKVLILSFQRTCQLDIDRTHSELSGCAN